MGTGSSTVSFPVMGAVSANFVFVFVYPYCRSFLIMENKRKASSPCESQIKVAREQLNQSNLSFDVAFGMFSSICSSYLLGTI